MLRNQPSNQSEDIEERPNQQHPEKEKEQREPQGESAGILRRLKQMQREQEHDGYGEQQIKACRPTPVGGGHPLPEVLAEGPNWPGFARGFLHGPR